ncbi:MAG: hypothetical protein CMA86_07440 [Euryarchaeota archaeon]|nr:hypothetical protein [Euryarchaeota archaeon]
MRTGLALLLSAVLLTSMVSSALAGSADAGEDINPDDSVPFSVAERTTPSQDGATWALSVTLDDEAHDNGTTLAITTQICLNSGVCDPPVTQDVTVSDDDRTYAIELTPPSDHSYVNWRVKATYSDDSTETFPTGDWYKTWSSCYYNDGTYEGVHADGDGCDIPASGESEGLLPFLGVGVVAVTLGLAVVVKRRS